MENKDEKLQNIIQNFNALDWDEQKKLSSYIEKVWENAHNEFVDMCSEDKELCEVYDYLVKAEEIMSFNLADHYYKYVATENGFDTENAHDIYEYDPDAVSKAKYISEHLEKVNEPLQAKLDGLNKQLEDIKKELEEVEKNGGMFKRIKVASLKTRMNKLDTEITSVKVDMQRNIYEAENYRLCMQKQAEKEKYMANYKTLVEPYKKLYEERTQKYADKVVEKYLESDPLIICQEHTTSMSGKRKRAFSAKPLNKACNDKRYEVLFAMKDKGVEKV